jgi:hypothetical protein
MVLRFSHFKNPCEKKAPPLTFWVMQMMTENGELLLSRNNFYRFYSIFVTVTRNKKITYANDDKVCK